ncbi:hypothetical protein ENUP19_0050G0045 [Entamoeba nuttalli]|uniref:START domain containing protein n=2 Tax=Entamoeba nuttalli TaxID=412467 RepID=K2G7S3_ENTNP|nr:START domain containing protein [Entamoeba nuttalli P19]EKE38501.1 START domain containing protein [Entamoeba nuttalli P19]|eukprot:XP_008859165.1 START domain containing protein [Entamoeba nuttalli P19]
MKPITDEEFNRFRDMCLNHEGWHLVSQDKWNIGYTMKTNSSSSLRLKLISNLFKPYSLELIFDMLNDPKYRKEWDVNLLERRVIEEIDEHNEIEYYSIKMPIVTNRDFVYQRAWRFTENEFIIFNKSIKDKRFPPVSGLVRAFFHISGYMVRKENEGNKLYYICHNEWNGWIPNFLINTIGVDVCPSVLGKMAEGCKKYTEWLEKQQPYERPWKKLLYY